MKRLASKQSRAVIILLVCLVSLLLGSRMVFHGDYYFLYDQARDLMLVKNIVINHKLTIIGSRSGIGGFFHGPLWLYLLVPFFIMTHGNPMIMPVLGMLVTVTTLITAYLVGAKLYGKEIGILLLFFLGIHEAIWSYITSILSVNLIPLLYLLFFYSLISFLRGNKRMFLFTAFLTGCSFQFETASSLILLPTVIVSFFTLKEVRKDVKLMLGGVGAFILAMLWYILFDLRHGFLMTKAVFQYITTKVQESGYLPFHERFRDHSDAFRSIFSAFMYKQNSLLTFFLLCIVIVGIILIYRNKNKKLKREVSLFLIFPLLIFLFLLRYPYPVYQEYILGLLVPFGFLITLSLREIWRYSVGKITASFFILCVVLFVLLSLFHQYGKPYQVDSSAGSLMNQTHVVDTVYEQSPEKTIGYFVYSPDTFTYQMDYLFWWRSSTYYKTVVSQKLPDTYLILYQPLAHDTGAHAFWKKNILHIQTQPTTKSVFRGTIAVERYHFSVQEPAVDPNYYQQLIFR